MCEQLKDCAHICTDLSLRFAQLQAQMRVSNAVMAKQLAHVLDQLAREDGEKMGVGESEGLMFQFLLHCVLLLFRSAHLTPR